MAIDHEKLWMRIQHARQNKKYSQEKFAEILDCSRELVNHIERARKTPSIETLVEIANALDVSADDLLVDSLKHSTSTANSELHLLLLDCNETEEKVLLELIKYMKPVLYRLGI